MKLTVILLLGALGIAGTGSVAEAGVFSRMMSHPVKARLGYSKLVRENPQLKPARSKLTRLSSRMSIRGVSGAAYACSLRKAEERIQVVHSALKAGKTVEPATIKWVRSDIKSYQAEMKRMGFGESNWLKSIDAQLKSSTK